MAFAGFNTQGASSLTPQATWSKKLLRVGKITAGANEQLTRIGFFGRQGTAGQRVKFALVRIDANQGGTGEHTVVQEIEMQASLVDERQEYILPTPIALEPGFEYALAIALGSMPGGIIWYDAENDAAWDLDGDDTIWDQTEYTATASNGKVSAFFETDTNGSADATDPTFSSAPAVSATTENGHTFDFTLNEGGTVYGIRMTNGAIAPTDGPNVKALHDAGISGDVLEVQRVDVVGGVPFSMTFSTGSASTDYDYYFVAEDHISTPNIQDEYTLVEETTGGSGPVVSPDPTIDSTSAGPYYPGDSLTLNTSNASDSGKAFAWGGVAVAAESESAAVSVIPVPNPLASGFTALTFGVDIPVTMTDGGETATVQRQISVPDGFQVVTVASKGGFLSQSEFNDIQVGHQIYCPVIQDADWANGIVPMVDTEQTYQFYVRNTSDPTPEWGTVPFEVTVAAAPAVPMSVVSSDPSMQRRSNYRVTVQDPPFTPTPSNIALVSGDDSLACTDVENLGNAQHRLTFAVGDLSKQVSASGYNWSVRMENS